MVMCVLFEEDSICGRNNGQLIDSLPRQQESVFIQVNPRKQVRRGGLGGVCPCCTCLARARSNANLREPELLAGKKQREALPCALSPEQHRLQISRSDSNLPWRARISLSTRYRRSPRRCTAGPRPTFSLTTFTTISGEERSAPASTSSLSLAVFQATG